MKVSIRLSGLLLILSLFLTACGDSTPLSPSPIAINIPSVAPTATPLEPTPTQAVRFTPADTPPVIPAISPTVVAATPTTTAQPTTTTLSATATPATTPTAAPGLTAAGAFGFPFGGRWVVENTQHEIVIYAPGGGTGLIIPGGSTPVFSPDGKRVAYTTLANPGGNGHVTTIKAVDLDGKNPETLCEGPFGNEPTWLVRWSPRSRYIAMYSRTTAPHLTDGQFVLCDLTSKKFSAPLKFKQGGLNAIFDWSPDGDSALWEGRTNDLYNLYYGDPDKNGEDAATPLNPQARLSVNANGGSGALGYYTSARFSPDGTTLAVAANNVGLFSVPGKTSLLAPKIFEDTPAGVSLAWLPDGKHLALLDPATKTLQVLNIETGKKTTVATQVVAFDWTRK